MLDLKKTYGKRYKIRIDASWDAETSENRTTFRQNGEEPYYYEILGKYGQIYNHSETHLQIWITPSLGAKLNRNLPPGWMMTQNASDGRAFTLPNSDIGLAFKWIKPRKRRVMSEEQRKAVSERLQAWKFTALRNAKTPGIATITPETGKDRGNHE